MFAIEWWNERKFWKALGRSHASAPAGCQDDTPAGKPKAQSADCCQDAPRLNDLPSLICDDPYRWEFNEHTCKDSRSDIAFWIPVSFQGVYLWKPHEYRFPKRRRKKIESALRLAYEAQLLSSMNMHHPDKDSD